MRYELDRDRSTLVIEARSSVGEIEWSTRTIRGEAELDLLPDGQLDADASGELIVELAGITSGNTVYDAELLRRIEARRYPEAVVRLTAVRRAEPPRFQLSGTLTFHGTTQDLSGTTEVTAREDGTLMVVGQQVVDIKAFAVEPPSMLMLKIYPDVTVSLVAVLAPASDRAEEG